MNKTRGKRPNHATRFRKGQSGNPQGRPRGVTRLVPTSSYDIILDRELVVSSEGLPQKMSLEEALQFKTYTQAVSGNRMAQREILKMIAAREKALAQRPEVVRPMAQFVEHGDPQNAYDALLLLEIAKPDPKWDPANDRGVNEDPRRLLLEPWAVQLALHRRRKAVLGADDVREIGRCTRDAVSLKWPRGTKDG